MDNGKIGTDKLHAEIIKLQTENEHLKRLLEHSETGLQTALSAISHELRNILTLLVGSARFLEQDHPELICDKIWQSLWTDLLHMQTFLMDLSSFKSLQNISLSRKLCDLNAVLQEICRDCQPLFDGTHKCLIFLCPKAPVILYADARKLAHVFTNLIKNALEALSSTGTVSLCIREALPEEASLICQRTAAAIEVKDTGTGLSKEQQEKIFEPFYSEKSGGTGLGLSIAQAIINAHSGMITVASAAGKGTVFTVLLPKLPTASVTDCLQEPDSCKKTAK
jgi:signal transduction histidine kinase